MVPLWTQVASVHHEYGRLTLATAGLLFSYGPHRICVQRLKKPHNFLLVSQSLLCKMMYAVIFNAETEEWFICSCHNIACLFS